ncbi:hypothetical protein L2E82_31912 [Cichorium intybus]|uniref:Uncharacterized protein n=1 Tax=Cichorium intybus TaxID=13427 RepID=A0ACB9BFR5_CICIN|nr:hypothetical protein L2E82_31912 [Cichorium intybus]
MDPDAVAKAEMDPAGGMLVFVSGNLQISGEQHALKFASMRGSPIFDRLHSRSGAEGCPISFGLDSLVEVTVKDHIKWIQDYRIVCN